MSVWEEAKATFGNGINRETAQTLRKIASSLYQSVRLHIFAGWAAVEIDGRRHAKNAPTTLAAVSNSKAF